MHTAILILWLLGAQADEAAANEAKAKAQVLLSEGTQFFNRGAMAEALDKFKEAYAEFASPKLMFNIGLTSRNLGRSVEAMEAFERFLAEPTGSPPDMIAEAQQAMSELRGALGSLTVKCNAPGAEISLDGRTIGFAPVPNAIWVMPGSHLATAKHPEFQLATVTVDVNAGTVHTLTLTLQRIHQEEPGPVSEEAKAAAPMRINNAALAEISRQTAPAAPEPQSQGWWLGRKWTWVAASSAVVFAGAATAFGLSMQSKYDSLNRSCGSASPEYSGCSSGDVDSVIWRRNAANVFWGLTAAAAVSAGVLFVLEGHDVAVAPVAGDATGLVARVSY